MSENNLRELLFNIKNKKILKDYQNILIVIFLFLILLISLLIYKNIFLKNDLTVRVLDIGQGDSILITTPEKKDILIDAGPDDKVVRKLEKYLPIFKNSIDLAIMTHSDADHVTGFYYVLKKSNVKNILQNGDNNSDTEVFKETQEKIKEEMLKVNSKIYTANCGDKIYPDSGKDVPIFYILSPIKNNLSEYDTNKNSIVALLVYGSYSFLFTGDMDKDIEDSLDFNIRRCFSSSESELITSSLKNLTVLKVSHHGSDTTSSERFIKSLKPEYSVISAGKNNRYGHPKEEVVKILEKYSKNILNTVSDGDIIFSTNGKDFSVIKK